ncbi:MAG: MFS transporter [Bacteroidota bacterium]
MTRYLTVGASFIIMLCIGSIYAWSIIAAELIEAYDFTASQSQLIFGTLIAIFPVSMIFVGQLGKKMHPRILGFLSGMLFLSGYLVASLSNGNFLLIWLGIGVLAGVGTGFGYWLSLTTPVAWFPERKGLVTGIAAAGFGLGAVLMSDLSEKILSTGKDVLQLFAIIGLSYGIIIMLSANFIHRKRANAVNEKRALWAYLGSPLFKKLFIGIFLGTFAGLLIIGNLKIIGEQDNLSPHYLVLGVSIFAVANFAGRIAWGVIADSVGASLSLFGALLVQAIAIIALHVVPLADVSFLLIAFMIGFGFGGNFVLFARETAHVFGIDQLGIVYPYVFLGYAIAGIAGPYTGGLLFDLTGTYSNSIYLSGFMSFAGSMLFLYHFIKTRKDESVQ